MRRQVLLGWLALVLPVHVVAAQDDCYPATDSHEAQAFAILSVPLAFTRAGGSTASSGWTMGIEAASLPEVPRDLATPTSCRPGKGPEDTNPIAGVVRLRLAVQAHGWQLEGGWVPPVTVHQVQANLVGLGVGRLVRLSERWLLLPRVHALLGELDAPVTCSAAAIDDPASECFGGNRSDDRWRPGVFGAEVAVSRTGHAVVPHLGLGYSLLRPRFQVHFTNALGETDRRRVIVDLERVALFAGVTASKGGWHLTAEGYATIGDRLTARLVVRRGG